MRTRNVLILILVTALLSTSLTYVFAPTPTSTLWVTPGVYPSHSVLLWRESSNYFAKSGYGGLLYGDTNATLAYETGRDYLTNGGTIMFKEGIYVFTHTLWLESNIDIIGSGVGNTILKQSGAADLASLIRIGSSFLGIPTEHNITLRDFTIYGRQGGAATNNGISLENATHVRLINIEIYHVENSAFRFVLCSNIYGNNLHAENVAGFQGYSTMGIFNSQFSNLVAIDCAGYGMDLSYAVNVSVNNLFMTGENTSLKIDLGNAGQYCDSLTLSNIIIKDFGGGLYNGMIIEEVYNSTITNFVIASGYRAIRVGVSAYSLAFSNGVISDTSSNGIYLADGDHLSFSNIILKDTGSTCFSIAAGVNYAVLQGINAREGGNIIDGGVGSQIHLSWNSTNWVS